MPVNVFIYSKCEGLTLAFKDAAGDQQNSMMDSNASHTSLQTTNVGESSVSNSMTTTLNESKSAQLLMNYTVKYGSQSYTWAEHNCDTLHKGKLLRLDYRLGQVDQTVSARSMMMILLVCCVQHLSYLVFLRAIGSCDSGGKVDARSVHAIRHIR